MVYTLDHGIIKRDGQPMASLSRALYGDGALSASELEAFRCEVVATMNAAPDMLAALESLTGVLSCQMDELSDANIAYVPEFNAALSAIAKAVQS